jgi:hypothetical protein
MPNPAHRIGERGGQSIRSIPIAFKQMKGDSLRRLLSDDSLRRLLSDAGHAPKTINQANEKR